jgi:hypothetical protein
MAANPRIVNKDTDVTWDGGIFHALAGTIVDVPAGSTLEAAYGSANLTAVAATNIDPGEAQSFGGTG